MNIYSQRLEAVRSVLRNNGWDALVITGSDPHNSEYPAPRWKQVQWLTGFGGEAGDVVITARHAGLWTDSRYFIEAGRVLPGTGYELHKTRLPESVYIPQWLATVAFPRSEDAGQETEEGDFKVENAWLEGPGRQGVCIAVDGASMSIQTAKDIRNAFVGRDEIHIVDCPDILDGLWEDRPAVPQTPIITLGGELTGEDRSSRINFLRKFLLMGGYDGILLTSLDEIAWILNVRGQDVVYNPVVISYMLVTLEDVIWYVQKGELDSHDSETPDSFDELASEGIAIESYFDAANSVSSMLASGSLEKLFCDPSSLNYNLFHRLSDKGHLVLGPSPIPARKAVKNQIEIAGMRDAHLEDGLAVEEFLFWVERNVGAGQPVSEWDAALYLHSLRSRIPGYRGDSFETISAYGPGAALPHYVTPQTGAPILKPHGLYLCDSGGQYLFGTTDITRTIPLGPCTDEEKLDYTLVLKGHIQLAMAVFPSGTAGCQIDALAREPLWRHKRNYGHGTGHGVGFYLCVHEGPQDIRQNFSNVPLLPGMIVSDEPGLYREGYYGIRHENLLLCRDLGKSEFGTWYGFETLTLCHFDTTPVLADMLTEDERHWLNNYNRHIYETLKERLPDDVRPWLEEKTRPI